MTYKSRLEQLLSIAIQKSNAFIDIVRLQGQADTPQYLKAQAEWEIAEEEYVSFLNMLKSSGVSPDDPIAAGGMALLARVNGHA